MRVAYYYNMKTRPRHDDPHNNPYGSLLCEALDRLGVETEFTVTLDEPYLRANQGRIDVLHFNWPHYLYYDDDEVVMRARMQECVRLLELARALGYRVVWTAHNLYPHNRAHQDIDHECRLALCRLASAVIAHCRVAAEGVRQTFGRSHGIFVIPHGTYAGVHTMPFSRAEARAYLGLPGAAFAYATLGNIRPYKGIEGLMDTFRALPGDAWLLISGGSKDVAYLDAVRGRAAGHPRIIVRLGIPKPSNEDFLGVLQAADVVALPYVEATTSGVLMLALSSGKPAIAPALGCLPELVTPQAGILYAPREPGALARAMLDMRRRDVAAAGRAALALATAPQYGWERIARLTVEAYRA